MVTTEDRAWRVVCDHPGCDQVVVVPRHRYWVGARGCWQIRRVEAPGPQTCPDHQAGGDG